MTKPLFVNRVSHVPADWANTVSALVYDVFAEARTVVDARKRLGVGSLGLQNANRVLITGGAIDGTPIGALNPVEARFTHVSVIELTPQSANELTSKQYVDMSITKAIYEYELANKDVIGGNAIFDKLGVRERPVSPIDVVNLVYLQEVVTGLTSGFAAKLHTHAATDITGLGNAAFKNVVTALGTDDTAPISQKAVTDALNANGKAAWGAVTGNLDDQLDLSLALSRKLETATLPLATTTTPGVVTVGGGLTVIAGALRANMQSFNTRVGPVTLQASDVSDVGGALLESPAFTGLPTAPTAALSTNNSQLATTAFVKTAIKAASYIIDVKQFGAVGDGVTDDTKAIQDALDYLEAVGGGALYIPTGVYMVMAPLTNYLWLTHSSNRKNYAALLMPSNTVVYGDGSKSVLKLIDTPPSPGTVDGRGDYSTTHILMNKNAMGLPQHIVDRNLTVWRIKFDGNNVQQSGEGVSFCGAENFLITECEFTQSYYETNYIVYSRGGAIHHNRMYTNGIYQIDGGGPMCDTSTDVSVTDNIIIDSGYYAVLLINCFNCRADNNQIFKESYSDSAGYQAIRVANCSLSSVRGNTILDSAYSAIWVHNGYCNSICDNIVVHAGYGAGAGSNLHGISIDFSETLRGGRHIVDGNKVFFSKGVGIALLEGIPYGVVNANGNNAGTVVTNNIVMYNNRDGIAVYGSYHRIIGNTVESNGLSITDGIPGNGYNGITLNGATHCIVTNNSCMDILQPTPFPLNLDGAYGTSMATPYVITHTARTQNYGIVEYPGGAAGNEPADYNTIQNNNVLGNLANPTGNGGYTAYNNGTIICGPNSVVKDNQGAADAGGSGVLPVANGGTGANSAAAALTSLGAAAIADNTFTGSQTIALTNPTLTLNETSGTGSSALLLKSANSLRWELAKSATTDNLDLSRYVAGVWADTPISVKNNTGVVVINKLTVAGALNPSGGIVAVDYAMEAAAGSIGEFISSNVAAGSSVALTSGTNTNVTSITLTPGDWEIYGSVATNPASTTTQSVLVAGLNTVSATMPAHPNSGASVLLPFAATAGTGIVTPVGRMRLNLNANTTVYLVVRCTFATSTNGAYGYIAARRMK